jgi:hypothetical protein
VLRILVLASLATLPGALWAEVPFVKLQSRGVVVDSATTQPIAGVRVTVLESAGSPKGCRPLAVTEVTTDSLGAYSLLVDCDAKLVYAKPGYRTKTLTWPSDLRRSLRFRTAPLRVENWSERSGGDRLRLVSLVREAQVK